VTPVSTVAGKIVAFGLKCFPDTILIKTLLIMAM
jgi:hypothetical protein